MKKQDMVEINGAFYPIVRDMTQEEEQQYAQSNGLSTAQQIEALKQQLRESDYKAIKYAEGWISEADYAPIKTERQSFRDKINALENKNRGE